jgi:hypothetical protein
MSTLPDFNLGTWQQRYEQGFIGATIGYFDSAPIPPVLVPYNFAERFVRISITADYSKSTWKRAARVYQVIPTFLGNTDLIDERLVDLNKPEIFDLNQYPDGYRLRLEFFPWLRDVNVLIHAWRA